MNYRLVQFVATLLAYTAVGVTLLLLPFLWLWVVVEQVNLSQRK